MLNKKLYYIISLIIFIIGVAAIGTYINYHRQQELFVEGQNMTGVIGSDENLKVNGNITATTGNNTFGNSKIPDENGNIILKPSSLGNVIVDGKLCFGNPSKCISSETIDTFNLLDETSKMKEGTPIKCHQDPMVGAIYQYTQGQRRHYQNPTIATSYDTNWGSAQPVNCRFIPMGPPYTSPKPK
jgi:hypothetical protein